MFSPDSNAKIWDSCLGLGLEKKRIKIKGSFAS